MNSEEAMEKYLAEYDSDTWEEHSDGYQRLLEECGDKLLPARMKCTKHPQPEVRASAASLLASRRPHTPEMIEAIAQLINDPEPSAADVDREAARRLAVDVFACLSRHHSRTGCIARSTCSRRRCLRWLQR